MLYMLQDVECLCVSDDVLVSAGLDGDIRVWNTDAMTRGCALTIPRGSATHTHLHTHTSPWHSLFFLFSFASTIFFFLVNICLSSSFSFSKMGSCWF